MSNSKTRMTFHESYGTLPEYTLRLIKARNVSPADLDLMCDLLGMDAWIPSDGVNVGRPDWSVIDDHILSNLNDSGNYSPRYF